MDSDTKTIVDIILSRQNLRSRFLLASFVRFCLDNKELRFWQAIGNWVGWAYVLVAPYKFNHPNNVPPDKLITWDTDKLVDTYHWEENRLPKDYENKYVA